MLDFDEFTQSILSHVPEASEFYKKIYIEEFRSAFADDIENLDMLMKGSEFDFLHCQKTGTGNAAVFRMRMGPKGFTYIRFFLDSNNRLYDFQNLIVGPPQSVLMADSLQRIIASDNGQVRPYSDGGCTTTCRQPK